MIFKKEIAFISGDNRQIYLANLFCLSNWSVYTYKLSSSLLSDKCIKYSDIESIINSCDILVFPFKIDFIPMEELYSIMPLLKNKIIFGGNIPTNITYLFHKNNVKFYDFFKIDYINRLNAIATAEGCIKEAIELSPYNLHGEKSLVLGYGNCGCVLASKLQKLNSFVTVSCRNNYQGACAISEGLKYININNISNNIHEYLFIFNTIPSLILGEPLLKKINPNSTIIDIASLPGGIDFKYTNKNNLKAKNIPGIPGKFSPMSSATILYDYIIDMISEIQIST